jgi:periplasmic protein TonB
MRVLRHCGYLSILFLLLGCTPSHPKANPAVHSESPRIQVGSTLNCNKLVHYVRQVYPPEAKQKRIQGRVLLRATITKTGTLRNLEVLSGEPMFVPAALDAVKQWRYTPCVFNAEPVEVIEEILIDFNLNQ